MLGGLARVCLLLFALLCIGSSFHLEPRIVNGVTSERGQFPFFAYLKSRERGVCGGVILSENYVLTAAHCLLNVTKTEVHLGSFMREDYEEADRLKYLVYRKHFYPHPEHIENHPSNDIALIKLPRPAVFSKVIQPISFPDVCEIPLGLDLTVMGYGRVADDDLFPSDTLQYMKVVTIPHAVCEMFFKCGPSVFCATGTNYDSIHLGDSGGPLVDTSDQTLYGIAIFKDGKGGRYIKQGFTNVLHYYPWLTEITGIEFKCSMLGNVMNMVRKYTSTDQSVA